MIIQNNKSSEDLPLEYIFQWSSLFGCLSDKSCETILVEPVTDSSKAQCFTLQDTTSTTPTMRQCSDGFTDFGFPGGCYKLMENDGTPGSRLNWQTAETLCASSSPYTAHLAGMDVT